MSYEIPLTPEQRDYAAKHHGLVYKFLNNNHLPEDEFYDVVIFGYLRAVRRYHTVSYLRKYAFSTIAWQAMHSDLFKYRRAQSCQKRSAEVVSLYDTLGPNSNYSLEETIPSPDKLMQTLEERLLLHELAGKVSPQQIDMVRRRAYGYHLREIARQQKTPVKRIKELLGEVHTAFLEICRES